jgi:hypothetical protein
MLIDDKNNLFSGNEGGRGEAITLFKKISQNYKLDTTIPLFQALDDAFLPGFNVDKAYVGHLYMYCKNAKTSLDVIKQLQKLNEASKKGLNEKGDRLSQTQIKKDKKQITKYLKDIEKNLDGDERKQPQKKALDNFRSKN